MPDMSALEIDAGSPLLRGDAPLMEHPFAAWRRRPDDGRFEALVRSCEGLIRQTAHRQFPGDAARQDELVQATICVLYHRGRNLRSPGALPAWLVRVGRNLACNLRRESEVRRRHEHEGATMLHAAVPAADPWNGIRPYLDEALAAMPRRLAEALAAGHLAGRGRAEAAADLGLGQAAFDKRVTRGGAYALACAVNNARQKHAAP